MATNASLRGGRGVQANSGELAYVLWHWRRPSASASTYEAHQGAFHAALAASRPAGFVRSTSSAIVGAPWVNGGAEGYQDRYFIENAAALDALDAAVARGAYRESHDGAARDAGGGVGGLYRIRLGVAGPAPRASTWFSKPAAMSYEELFADVAPLVEDGAAWLWMRRLVLGPTPEFCLESANRCDLPERLRPLRCSLRPVWFD